MRRAVVGACALVAVVAFSDSTASAGCIAPTLTLSPSTAAPGAAITVDGKGFFEKCNDTVPPGTPPGQLPPPPQPATGIRVVFVQSGQEATLTTTDADAALAFLVTVQIPASASSGPATITARASGPEGVVSASAPLVVSPAQDAPETPPVQPRSLPHTGGLLPLAFGTVSLLLGLLLCLGSRALELVQQRD